MNHETLPQCNRFESDDVPGFCRIDGTPLVVACTDNDPEELRMTVPKAKAAVLKALELDNTLAEAHFYLGILAFWYDWDWTTAEREMKRAIELDPTYSMYGLYLAAMGKPEEAIQAFWRRRTVCATLFWQL